MNKHLLNDYLNVDSLTPDRDLMGEVSDEDWWTACADNFDDLIWLYYPNRTVFLNNRFPFNPLDPDNTDNIDTCINNIKRTFSIYLKSNNIRYKRMWDAINAEYNPLYNVDAFEFEDTNGTNTGTDTNAKTGTDTNVKSGNMQLDYSGKEANTKSGNETVGYAGSEASTRSGSEDDTHTTDEISVTYNTTYDSDTEEEVSKTNVTPAPDTHTYNSVADTKTFTDRVDTHTYNDVKDEKSFTSRYDKTTYNNVQDQMTYLSTDTETKNLAHDEHLVRRRYGNIGITKSTELIQSELELVSSKLFDFYKTVVHDCVNLLTFAVE